MSASGSILVAFQCELHFKHLLRLFHLSCLAGNQLTEAGQRKYGVLFNLYLFLRKAFPVFMSM